MANVITAILDGVDLRKAPPHWLEQFESEKVVDQYVKVFGLDSPLGDA